MRAVAGSKRSMQYLKYCIFLQHHNAGGVQQELAGRATVCSVVLLVFISR